MDSFQLDAKYLRQIEPIGIAASLASFAYNRSQGRALAKDQSKRFVRFVVMEVSPKLKTITTKREFDQLHHGWVTQIRRCFRRTKEDDKTKGHLSYGEGQKALNVWLKMYVDWAFQPDMTTAKRLRRWLHCPLDKYVMEGLKKHDKARFKKRGLGISTLKSMTKPQYYGWQKWINCLSPKKPVLIDLLWVFADSERRALLDQD